MSRASATVAVAATVVALVPTTASAAPFGELPFTPVRGSAVCLSPTGTPGEIVRWAAGGAEVLDATPSGLVSRGAINLGALSSCPVAATDPGGAGVAAGAGKRGLALASRDPGQLWSAPQTVAAKLVGEVSVAVSARGDAVVAWAEYAPPSETAHVLVARRVAGGPFGAPQRFAASFQRPALEVAVTADGTALLTITDRRAVQLATAAPGAPFGAPRTLARAAGDGFGSGSALAVTPDGRALLAANTGNGVALFDREPGSDFVQRPSLPGGGDNLAVGLAPDGTAIVASGSGESVSAVMRDGLGSFAAPVHITVPARPVDGFQTLLFSGGGDGPPLETSTPLRVALGSDRRALMAWSVDGRGLRAATVTTAGLAEVATLAGPLRDALGATPLVLAGGTRAVAWTDDNDILSVPPYAGRLHLAVEGAAVAPAAPAPRVTVGAPADRSLRPAQPIVLPVRCSAACDVRLAVVGQDEGAKTASLSAAGTLRLRFEPRFRAIVPVRGPLKLELRSSAAGATTAETRTVSLRVRRLPAPPFPRILNLRTRRGSGGVIDVRWSTDVAVRDAYFYVFGTHTRRLAGVREGNLAAADGAGRRSFHVRLHDGASVRYVRVQSAQRVGRRTQTKIISVRSRA